MKKLILPLILLISLFSCRSIEDIKLQSSLLEKKATVIEINSDKGYVTLYWDCANRPYKRQPCYGISKHPISLFENTRGRLSIDIGDTLQIVKKGF